MALHGYRECESSVTKTVVHAKRDCTTNVAHFLDFCCSSRCPGQAGHSIHDLQEVKVVQLAPWMFAGS